MGVDASHAVGQGNPPHGRATRARRFRLRRVLRRPGHRGPLSGVGRGPDVRAGLCRLRVGRGPGGDHVRRSRPDGGARRRLAQPPLHRHRDRGGAIASGRATGPSPARSAGGRRELRHGGGSRRAGPPRSPNPAGNRCLAVHGVGPGDFDWHPPRAGARQPDTPGTRRGVSSAVYGPALADAVGPARGAVRDWRSTGRSGAGPIQTARGSTRRRRPGWVMAGSFALAPGSGPAGHTFVIRAIGPFLPNIPAAITQRPTVLAPALLAARVAYQLTGPNDPLLLYLQS